MNLMIRHYLKVTLREFAKYKTQSLVSIIGLAIGFTAFILGGYWLCGKHISITFIRTATGFIA